MIDEKLIQVEQEILSMVMNDQDARLMINQISSKDFCHPLHQDIYEAFQKMTIQNMPIDDVTIFEYFRRNKKEKANEFSNYLIGLQTMFYDLSKFSVNAEIILDRSNNRKLKSIGEAILKGVYSLRTNSDIINQIQQGLDQIGESIKGVVRSRSEILKSINSRIDRVQKGEFEFVNLLGIFQLDKFLRIEPGYLITIAGQSNIGKSFACSQIAANIGTEKGVLLYSLEMLDEQYIRRIISAWCGSSASNIKAGKIDRTSKPFIDASEKYLNSRIHICDDSSISIMDMEMKALSIKREEGLDVIIIDHLGLINYGSGRQSDTEKTQELMPKLKAMAKKLEVVVVLVSQLKKDSYNTKLTLSSLKGSGSIIECSDVILGLYDHEESGRNIAILKNREGKKDVGIQVNLNIDRSRFEPYDSVYQTVSQN